MRLTGKNRMKKTTYFEDWNETNPNEFDHDAIDERLGVSTESHNDDGGCNILPSNFDYSLFDCGKIPSSLLPYGFVLNSL